MKQDVPGQGRRRLLLSRTVGYKPIEHGKRTKKSIRGNTIAQEIVQINMKVTKEGAKPIDQIIAVEKKPEGEKPAEEKK